MNNNQEFRDGWQRWRNILDRIVSNKHYRYDDPQKFPYIKLMRFAQDMLGHYNGQYWRDVK
jgi:hypothetical protein